MTARELSAKAMEAAQDDGKNKQLLGKNSQRFGKNRQQQAEGPGCDVTPFVLDWQWSGKDARAR